MYFVTLIPDDYSNRRCIGYTGNWRDVVQLSTRRDNERLYSWMVVEWYEEGFDVAANIEDWWRWNGDQWEYCEPPPFATKIRNWAIC